MGLIYPDSPWALALLVSDTANQEDDTVGQMHLCRGILHSSQQPSLDDFPAECESAKPQRCSLQSGD